MHGVASRKVADARRALARHPLPTDDLPDDGRRRADARGPVGPRQRRRSRPQQLLGSLPERLREVMVLRVGAGLSAEETGAALGMTPGAVRVAQHRALAKMRQLLVTAGR